MSPAFTQVQLKMEGERRRQEKQAVLIRTRVLSGTRAASACQMKSISQWEAVGTVPHGPFHHLSHFIHATTAASEAPHGCTWSHAYANSGYRVMKTIPMYECRTYCKQSIEEICAGEGGGNTWKRCIIWSDAREFARSKATRHFWKRGRCAIKSWAWRGSPCQDSGGLPLQSQSSVDDPCAARGWRFCVKNAEVFLQRWTAPSAIKRQLSIPRTPAERRTIRRPLAPSPLLFYLGFYSVCRVFGFFFFFCLMISAQSEIALLQRHIQRAAQPWSSFMQI